MTIEGAHADVYAHIQTPCDLTKDLRGKKVAIDIASFKLKAFAGDVANFYRPGSEPSHGYRSILVKLLSTLTHCTAGNQNVVVVLDGGRLPPKAAENLRRDTNVDRQQVALVPATHVQHSAHSHNTSVTAA